MAVCQSPVMLDVPASSPASQLPQVSAAHTKAAFGHNSPVGAGLPAMAVYQSPVMLDVPASSPASQLPQVSAAHTNAMYAKNPL